MIVGKWKTDDFLENAIPEPSGLNSKFKKTKNQIPQQSLVFSVKNKKTKKYQTLSIRNINRGRFAVANQSVKPGA